MRDQNNRHLMLFRSATLGYLDLTRDAGVENFGGIRASCWFNAIPAGLAAQKPFTDSQYFKAVSSEKLKQAAQAQALLESFTATAKDSRWYYNGLYRLGVLLLRGQDRERGIGLLEQVRAGSAKAYLKTNASIVLGDYYAAGSPEKAIPFLDEAILKAGPGKKNSRKKGERNSTFPGRRPRAAWESRTAVLEREHHHRARQCAGPPPYHGEGPLVLVPPPSQERRPAPEVRQGLLPGRARGPVERDREGVRDP